MTNAAPATTADIYLAAMQATATKPLPANAARRAAEWATWVPELTDQDLADRIAYWATERQGSAQRRWVATLHAEAARRAA